MKIALIAGGRLPIPSRGWGAIEYIIELYKNELEKKEHSVDIYNSTWIHEVVYELNRKEYDFIHLHWDLFALYFNTYLKKPYCLTSHCGGFAGFVPGNDSYYPAFNYIFKDSLNSKGNIVLSNHIKKLYKDAQYNGFLEILPNPVDVSSFSFKEKGNGKVLCLGTISPRKRQVYLSKILSGKINIEFAGPFNKKEEPEFHPGSKASYIGNLSRKYLQKNMTNYSCLVLLSKSEADPLVVKEALAGGLSVVLNKSSASDFSSSPFISILPDGELNSTKIINTIQKAVEENDKLRTQIRDYAFSNFDISKLTLKYEEIINDFMSRQNAS